MMAVTQGLGDGYALYNGVKLPNIDKVYKAWTDKETHPYAYIIDNLKNDEYLLTLSSQEAYVDSTNSLMTGNGAMLIFKLTAGSDSYSLYKSSQAFEHSYSYSKSNYSFVWANHDILKDSTVYYSASSPIPLDGMQVIEWDGDTTGLENLYEMQYKVSDTILRKDDFTNCVVVMTYADRIAVGQGVEGLESEGIAMSEVDGVMSIYSEDNQYGISTGLWFGKTDGVAYTSLFAYTAAVEEQPKWQFNLRDFLSGIAAAAASRGVPRRTPIAYLYNGVQLPALPEVEGYAVLMHYGLHWVYLYCSSTPVCGTGNTYPHTYNDVQYESPEALINTGIRFKFVSKWEEEHEDIINTSVSGVAEQLWYDENPEAWKQQHIFWTNHDIVSADGNTVLLAKSDPIPVYK